MAKIKDKDFLNCTSLTKIKGGKNINHIGKSAFQNCKKLKKLTLTQKKLQIIDKKAFYGCKSLKKVTIQSKALTGVKAKAFKKCHKKITFKVPKSKAKKYAKLFKGKY